MPGPVFDKLDQVSPGPVVVQPVCFIQNITDHLHKFNVLHLTVAPDIVDLSGLSGLHDDPDGGAVIPHKKPIPYVETISVNRQEFSFKGI